jgi:hypothetical protein
MDPGWSSFSFEKRIQRKAMIFFSYCCHKQFEIFFRTGAILLACILKANDCNQSKPKLQKLCWAQSRLELQRKFSTLIFLIWNTTLVELSHLATSYKKLKILTVATLTACCSLLPLLKHKPKCLRIKSKHLIGIASSH